MSFPCSLVSEERGGKFGAHRFLQSGPTNRKLGSHSGIYCFSYDLIWYPVEKLCDSDNGLSLFFVFQVIPKITTGIASEVDHLLGNRPHSKKDFHH